MQETVPVRIVTYRRHREGPIFLFFRPANESHAEIALGVKFSRQSPMKL